jgi:thiamine pyrophosphokinase
LRHALALGLKPLFVVGDMDSLPKGFGRAGGARFLCDFDENRSDFEKALSLARRLGAREVRVAGNAGGRLDHRMANQAIAERLAGEMEIAFIDEGFATPAGPGVRTIATSPGETVSILPSGGPAVVSTRGLAFALRRGRLLPGGRGLSNRATGRRAVVRVHRGLVWIVHVGA